MKRATALIILGLCALPMAVSADAGKEMAAANQAYKEGRYREAHDGYMSLLRDGGPNGHIYYNLGNAAFRMNRIGQAILYYERSLLLLPRDPDLKFNLNFAREQVRDAIPASSSFLETAFFWLGSLTLAEILAAFVAVNLLFWSVMILRLFHRADWTFHIMFALLIAWAAAGVSLGVKWYLAKNDFRAVILQGEVNVLAGPDSGDTVLFKLHEGAAVRWERAEDGWSLIRLPDEKRGWLRSESLERIRG